MFKQAIEETLKEAQKAFHEEVERKNFNIAIKIQNEISNLKMQLQIIG